MNRTDKYTFGRTTVASAGGGTQLANVKVEPKSEACIRAIPGNTGNVYIGNSLSNAANVNNRLTLKPGDSIEGLNCLNLNIFYLNVDTANDGIEYAVEGT